MTRWLIVACAAVTLAGCADGASPPMIDLVFLTREGCVNTDRMRANLDPGGVPSADVLGNTLRNLVR